MPSRGPHRSVKRRSSHRSPRARVLVVCEGASTEPLYFNAIRDRIRLNTLVVKATNGVDPRTLVNMASKEDRREKRNGERFDAVYCVFDRDSHPQFQDASKTALDRGFKLARSWPCFEFWLLLHFGYVRRAYERTGSASRCDACIRDLRKHLPNYSKRGKTTFDDLWHLLDEAIANGYKAAADAEATGEPNPSTEVHELVVFLRKLAEVEATEMGQPA